MLEGIKKIHLIGIGGTGMRAIANVLLMKGFEVSGSDVKETLVTQKFADMGANICIGHDANAVVGADAVVISTAIPESNPELVMARSLQIPILHRSDIVKEIVGATKGIAVAGAHGKTTTTSMLGQIFEEAALDPTIVIGGEVNYLQGNSTLGHGSHSIVEADESDGSFLKLVPHYIVLTNIENDHMDHYGTMDNLKAAFRQFLEQLPCEEGLAVICGDSENVREVAQSVERKFITYGCEVHNEYQARDIRYIEGKLVFDVYHKEFFETTLVLQVPGAHNVQNALGAYALSHALGIEKETIQRALHKFIGAKRRFETKGHIDGVWIVDDYAHHPTEIKATLHAAKSLGTHRVICVFQPHRYTRTKLLLEEFARAFIDADEVVLTDIYSAGEAPLPGVDGQSIPQAIKAATGKTALYVQNSDDLPQFLADFIKSDDLVITMGAGNITQYGAQLLALLEDRSFINDK